ncbi:flagellar export chaperone FliS [Ammoniphilus sp. YIM 78166]|uniref:flagellar export chaperone FliS n=1 Tax=Ammoniphilus sp. YIM 78166 TaxID=1644106 RepID=UPI00106F4483|nr:flagellar export chaperone FliS [Ammoniphilus sp. YIM 78166]
MSMLAYQKYQQNQVTMSSPAELTLMLYRGAVRFINASKQAILDGRLDDANTNNLKAQDIIRELMVTLNMDVPMSQNFMTLYEYILSRLIQANIKKDTEILDEVKGYCEDFALTWAEAMKLAKK